VAEVKKLALGYHKCFEQLVQRSTVSPLMNDVVTAVEAGERSLSGLATVHSLSEWANKCNASKLDWQFKRYANYLQAGTIEKLNKKAS
jgi:hypothetical protein